MSDISRGLAGELVKALEPPKPVEVPEGSRIMVHAAVSRFAVLYEKIRNAVDYKDEHLLRKAAISRILKRQLILESDPEIIAKNLVRELIGACYLPNGELSEDLITKTAITVKKYQTMEKCRLGSGGHMSWLLRIVTVEIEDILVDNSRDKALVTFLYERLAGKIKVQEFPMEESDVRLQVYVACSRALIKADDDILGFKLLRAYMSEWMRPDDWLDSPKPVAERLIGVERRIRLSLTHPLSQKFFRTVRPWAVALNLLCAAILDKPEEASLLFEKPELLDVMIARMAERNYKQAKAKLRRGAVRAIIYLFLTKMLLALAIEIPVETWLYEEIAVPALVVNLLFPPVLMFFVWLFISVPGKNNTVRLQQNVKKLLSTGGVPPRDIRLPRKKSWFARVVLKIFYAVMFFLIFGTIGYLLIKFRFTFVSAGIFVFFLCVVSFFAFRLRQNAREYVVIEDKDSFRSVLMDFFSLPILRSGQMLSQGISRLNVFLFFFDFILETPYKILLTILEEWFSFLKEKKEELQ
ncbi:MAG: hypothetical protein ABIB04_03070 [Patescibacteria group bacterium]